MALQVAAITLNTKGRRRPDRLRDFSGSTDSPSILRRKSLTAALPDNELSSALERAGRVLRRNVRRSSRKGGDSSETIAQILRSNLLPYRSTPINAGIGIIRYSLIFSALGYNVKRAMTCASRTGVRHDGARTKGSCTRPRCMHSGPGIRRSQQTCSYPRRWFSAAVRPSGRASVISSSTRATLRIR